MKLKNLATALLLSVVSVSCVKVESKKVEIPNPKKVSPIKSMKAGLRCDLLGSESKEVFLIITEKDSKTSINIHDYLDAERISLMGATIEGFQTLSFNMEESEVEGEEGEEPRTLLVGSSTLLKTKDAVVDIEGSLILSKATLYLDKEFSGNIVLTHKVRSELGTKDVDSDNSISIENCEKAEASFF